MRRAEPRFGHLVLRTNRLVEMGEWYCVLLRARVVARTDKTAFLTYDEEHHRIALADCGPLAEARDDVPGMAHVAFAHASVGELLDEVVRLRALGIEPKRAVDHEGEIATKSFYFRDPDGNFVELFADVREGERVPSPQR